MSSVAEASRLARELCSACAGQGSLAQPRAVICILFGAISSENR